jgi:hypothetical protein
MTKKKREGRGQTYLQRWQEEYRKAAKASLHKHLLMTLVGFGVATEHFDDFLKDCLKAVREDPDRYAVPPTSTIFVPPGAATILGVKLCRVILEHAKKEELKEYEDKILLVHLEMYLEEEGYENPTELVPLLRREIGVCWDPHDRRVWRNALVEVVAKGLA